MSSRDRLMRAYHLEETDRVPVTLSYVDPLSGPGMGMVPGHARFQNLVRKKTDVLLPASPEGRGPFFSSTDQVSVESEEREEGPHTYHHRTLHAPGGDLHQKSKSERGVNTTWIYEGYIKSDEDVEKVLSIPFDPLEIDATPVHRAVQALGEGGVVSTGISDPVCNCAGLFTLKDFALVASRHGKILKKLLRFFQGRIEDYARQVAEQCNDVFFRIVGPEYVTPPILSPDLFEEYVLPYDRRLTRIVKENDNLACIHCHGKIGGVMDGMKKIDPHVLEPVEPPPGGDITLAEIKEEIGDRTCLMGYLQHNDLEFCSPGAIRKMVRSNINAAGTGGGYIVFPTARPYAAISEKLLENYREVIAAARKYGQHGNR
jgi:hypothetical protein